MTVRTASKDILARCMATENIVVEHRADAETAYFDVKNRVLCLPVWKDMDSATYDMLVGHEVSHALHTPDEGWQEWIGEGTDAPLRKQFLNVVEDARIERLIKAMFPGLRRDFASAYASLHDRDLFQIDGQDISTYALLDRLNLHFKIGLFGLEAISFSSDEEVFVERMAETETFEEVCALAQDLYERHVDEQEDAPEAGTEGIEGESGETQETPGGAGESDDDSSDEESTGSGSGDQESDGDETDGDESGDSGQSMEDDTDDGESADSESSDSSDSADSGQEQSENIAPGSDPGKTQRAFDDAVNNLRDEEGKGNLYFDLPKPNLDNIVVDFPVVDSIWNNYHCDSRFDYGADVKTYLNSTKAIVNHMVQEFQRKQAAESFKRSETAKTGILDTVKMTNYRWSEDIFLRNEVHYDGKNHGVVLILDWSGSMHPILKDTVEQLLVLTEFCRKMNVPFEVYAFSSNRYCPTGDRWGDDWHDWCKNNQQWDHVSDDNRCSVSDFSLYNLLSSRMNKAQMTTALARLWRLGLNGNSPSCLSLGATPLNEAIIAGAEVVNRFQQANGVDIVNTVFLTDGEGGGITSRWGGDAAVLRDSETKKQYIVKSRGYSADTETLLEWFKDRTGSTTIGIRLHPEKSIKSLRWNFWGNDDEAFETACVEYKKNNFVCIDSNYDAYFLVKGDLKVETDAMESLSDDASYTRIKNAFIKGGTRKKSSRVIATRIVDLIAV